MHRRSFLKAIGTLAAASFIPSLPLDLNLKLAEYNVAQTWDEISKITLEHWAPHFQEVILGETTILKFLNSRNIVFELSNADNFGQNVKLPHLRSTKTRL